MENKESSCVNKVWKTKEYWFAASWERKQKIRYAFTFDFIYN
jgi:hypothetical protein